MKLTGERHLDQIPRPYPYLGWEERSLWGGIAFGDTYSDDILRVGFVHELSDRQYRWLDRTWGWVERRRYARRGKT